MIQKIIYFLRRKGTQIKNVIKWLPVVWNQYDFDYSYSIKVFRFQLEKTANYLESDKAHTTTARLNASKIRMVLRLMDKVYDEEYALEYMDTLKSIYGDDIFDSKFIPSKNGHILRYKYEDRADSDKITKIKLDLHEESIRKQKRAHKLLWQLIEHNIQYWWD